MGKKLQLSEKEIQRRKDLARKLREEGKFGGAQRGSGRPKGKRASEIVAEGIREDATKILSALRVALKSNSPTVKLKAALAMLDIEAKETSLQLKEEKQAYENMSRDKLLELIGERFKQLEKEGVNVEAIILGRVGREGTENIIEADGRALPSGEEG